ncbi:MAG: transcription antitermination factor NusB [Chloroflexi bacterium]|nr:transcription antitermination factor NusB [Chloroflexota bacterium]
MKAVRRQARVIALETLFEVDCVGHAPERVYSERIREVQLPEEALGFAHDLVQGVLANLGFIDDLLQKAAPSWPIDQMAKIDVNILRLAIYEITKCQQVPIKVAINEAVELAKLYGSDSSGKFVNGVLGTVARQVAGRAA